MAEISAKVLIVGGGPGGYVTAIRAGQLGLDVVLVEQGGQDGGLGGTCLNVGCIPSKAIIHAADAFHTARQQAASGLFGVRVAQPTLEFARTLEWKNGIVGRLTSGVGGLLKRHGVKIIHGHAEMLATGSQSSSLPGLPFGGNVISSTDALSLQTIPERLVVVGAGYIGLELGTAFAKLGSKVTIVEAEDRLLPAYDSELTRPVARRLRALGVEVLTGTRAAGLTEDGKALRVTQQTGPARELAADRILVATGRRPRTEGLGLERLDLTMNGSFVRIDERCATSMYNVWAVGDLTGEPMLAHRAMAQGVVVAEAIAGHRLVFDAVAIPAVCFTDPEIATVGLSPEMAKAAGHDVHVGSFPLSANGRALTLGAEDGFVRVTARSDNHLILGIAAVGAGIAELSTAFGMALEMGARLEDVGSIIHAHPTLGEAFHEASLRGLGEALHI